MIGSWSGAGPHRPLFSVVLPTYNRVDIVMEAVQSVLAQSFTDFELIVVDDLSTDSTAARIARVTDPRVWLVTNQGRKGGAGARNYGTSVARGTWICQIDSDDLWDEHMLEHLAAGVLRAAPTVGVVYGSDHTIDIDTGAVRRRRVAELSGWAFPKMLERHFYHHCAAAIRRDALLSVGGYDEELHGMEDTDLQHRLTESWEVLAVPEAIYYYRLGRSDQVTRDYGARAVKMQRFLRKHDAQLRTMPRSMVKIAAVVMVTCVKGGRWADAARLWGRVLRYGPSAPRLVLVAHMQVAVVLRDRVRRSLARGRPASQPTSERSAVGRAGGTRGAPARTHERSAEPT
jgi:glycosyltransferase involved in cell wall biosynthesis